MTIVLAAFLAILVDTLVVRVAKIGLGRAPALGFVVLCFMLLAGTLAYFLYSRASAFADEYPSYTYRIQEALAPVISKLNRIQRNAESITPISEGPKHLTEVTVKAVAMNWSDFLIRGVGSISGVLTMGGVLPFLVVFMLAGKD